MARNKNKPEAPGAPEWMVTYSDIVTLLLTFFVMLLAQAQLTKVDYVKLRRILEKIRVGFPNGAQKKGLFDSLGVQNRLALWYRRHRPEAGGAPHEGRLGSESRIEKVRDGIEISFGGRTLFSVGDWRLNARGHEVLDLLIPELLNAGNRIDVRGHTGGDPRDAVVRETLPGSPGMTRIVAFDPGNPAHAGKADWNLLGMLRAREVADYLIGSQDDRHYTRINPARIRISSHGKFDPIANGMDPDTAHMNRRVSFFLMNEDTE